MRIPGLRGIGPLELVTTSVKEFVDDDMVTHAAALAYEVLFSIFPFIIFLIALLGFLELSDFFEWLQERAQILLPQEAMQPVNAVIDELQQKNGSLASLGMIMTLWTASAAMRVTMHALNIAHDVSESRPVWKRFPLSIFYTIGIAVMLIAAIVLLAIGPQTIQWLAYQAGVEQLFVILWAWLRWPAALLLLMLVVALIYYVAPDAEQEFHFISPGATIAVLAWIAASLGFNYYLRNFGDYSATYGSIGAIIALLLYFFLSSAVMLFGAEVNAVIEQHDRAR
ncbi:YihY/virulence factor BrkB family protein [Noviherbaspirillum cavernae]|uniref:YihY/virulence factor BrkB family protein n=1 Tax=Noviherbaspirillum cavernae TaxID=2320862 RepID=A0A418X585_9BURK|nr:YihY/virulence factor BrkB family protein [Noviherbaspirillum cavernae]RJG07579.1 YihY/virulence factor BrkB family protein [Noviherbaspirillum cavernae]